MTGQNLLWLRLNLLVFVAFGCRTLGFRDGTIDKKAVDSPHFFRSNTPTLLLCTMLSKRSRVLAACHLQLSPKGTKGGVGVSQVDGGSDF